MTRNNRLGKLNITKNDIDVFDKEEKISKHVPMAYFVTEDIFSTKDGQLGCVIKVAGTAFEVTDLDEMNRLQFNVGQLIKRCGDEILFYFTTHRHQQPNNLEGHYPDGFSHDFAHAYYKKFANRELYVNDLYITVMQKNRQPVKQKITQLAEYLGLKAVLEERREKRQVEINDFQSMITNLVVSLAPYRPSVVGKQVTIDGSTNAGVMSFLSIILNGEARNYGYPTSSIASTVPERRIFFGQNAIHFEGITKDKDKFAAILSIKDYCPMTQPGMMNELLKVPFEYISTHSFIGIAQHKAVTMIEKQINRLTSVGDKAISQIVELDQAMDDLVSGRISYGMHHHTICILSDDMPSLDGKVGMVYKAYQDRQMVVVRETMNLENTFWAQVPGNIKYIKRQAPISSNNISSYCSLHNYPSGYVNRNHLGGALMLVETPSRTPFYFNLHERASGRANDLPKGHSVIFAPSNGGKTVIMTAISTMYQKHGIKSIFFDRNQGCEVYVGAMGGVYNRLSPGEPTHWNPFQLQDTPKNRDFLVEFLTVLCSSRTQILTSGDHQQISEVIHRNFTLPFEKRTLSNIASFFRMDFTGLDALSRYVRLADRMGKSGDKAYLFDNETDSFNLNADTLGFDMTHWLGQEGNPSEELLPITMYIFHRLEEEFGSRLTGIFIDEGHQWLAQPYWQKKLKDYLMTLRKKNVFIFFATQSPEQVINSEIGADLIEGSATLLLMANPKANKETYCQYLKLSNREYELVTQSDPLSRMVLVKQGHESAIVIFNFSDMERYLTVLSSNSNTVKLCEEIRKEVGDLPKDWLPIFYERAMQ